MSRVKKSCICALCLAFCYVLPVAFHAFGLGMAFSPLHLPVLLCGVLCGWTYGLVCGVLGPVLSSVLSSMPAAAQLVYMIPELCVYGLVAGVLSGLIRSGRPLADLYLSLVPAMLAGRVAGGAVRAMVFLSGGQAYSLSMWAAAYLVGTWPAVVMQLIVIPALVLALTRARLIPERYPGKG